MGVFSAVTYFAYVHDDLINTVNSEIFTRILLSQIALKTYLPHD